MKADKSFQIKAKHLHLFLQTKFPLTWLTVLFSLVWLVKYISSCLITWMGSLVSWSMLISTSFSCFLDASWFNLVHSFWDGLGVNGKKVKWKTPILKFISIVLSSSELSVNHTNETKRVKLDCMLFMFLCEQSFCHVTLNRFFYLSLT